MLIRTGGNDATKRTMHVCTACAAEAEKWLDEIGLHVGTAWDRSPSDPTIYDALIDDLPETDGTAAS